MKKRLLVGLLAGCTILGATVGGYAASNFHLIVNGNNINADVQVIDGKSYVPLRAIGEALGAKVDFDGSTNTISISSSGTSNASVPAQSSVSSDQTASSNQSQSSDPSAGLSRSNPAPIGQTVTVEKKDILDDVNAAITLKQVIRGDQAWQMIKQANLFNSAPNDGYEYLLAKINFNLISNKDNQQLHLASIDFKAVSSDGKVYDPVMIVAPTPKLLSDLYPGATNEGWVALQVSKDDTNPLITYGRDYQGQGGAWFKLTN